jgi:hypothetical protein
MIGIHAILWDAAFWALGLFMLAGAVGGLIRPRKPTNVFNKNDIDNTNACRFILILAFVMLASLANLTLRELRLHSDLSHLRAEAVERIEIGNRAVTDRQQIAEIVGALNHAEWYSLRRGDAADGVAFVVKLVSGKRYDYEATRYQHGEGAAIVSRSPSGWENGQVFCRQLPALLAKARVILPPCFTYFGQPQHCAAD